MKLPLPGLSICSHPKHSCQITKRLRVLTMKIKQNDASRLKACMVRYGPKQISDRIRFARAGATDYCRVSADQAVEFQIRTDRLGAGNTPHSYIPIFVTWGVYRFQV